MTVAHLVEPCLVIDAWTPVADVDTLFRRDERLAAVVVARPDGPALLTRTALDTELTGVFGYGRSLHFRSAVSDLDLGDQLVLTAALPLTDAAQAVLRLPAERRQESFLVLGADGTPGVVTVARIFQELSSSFREIALRDPLTGLPNRRMLDERGAEVLEHADTPRDGALATRLAMLYVDLDGFKQVNDTLGHQAGDQLLVQFADRLVAGIRSQDLAARLGGDEFAVLLVDVTEEEAVALAERIVHLASDPFVVDGRSVHISASVGFALAEEVADEAALTPLDVLLRHADDAMLHAKDTGKSRVARLQAPGAAVQPARHAAIRRRLRDATHRGAFTLHYQPKLELVLGQITSVEALIRWSDEELGPVAPAEFIAVAERSGQITTIGSWVLDAACAQARRWLDDGTPLRVAINVSPAQLAATDVAQEVLDTLARHGVPPDLLQVEVTEGVAVTDARSATAQLLALETAGVHIHLDDFGTGYSSLSMLRELPISTLKVDRSIVARVDTDAAERHLLAGVVNAAHALGLAVVAEGVEREAQLVQIRELGMDGAQGYLLARPVPAEELPAAALSVEARWGRPAASPCVVRPRTPGPRGADADAGAAPASCRG
ncbi:EAL domain-containing protein [Actinotalea sp. BY-33]|uniref:EAL domain-containing protein n=1 Tax=Actinotalea soli TaxID=2819234 RepID=A0A939LN83_9CELL|nr:EAL domain-containing protein [Actinotalea soli]MBO1751452.1 EAL domain-containing protein [Actinotalea soli]